MKNENLEAGLEPGQAAPVTETEKKRVKRVQTTEERAAIVAGVAKLKELGVSENVAKVLDTLVPEWHGGNADALKAAKEEVITALGGTEKFKDLVEGELKEALLPYQGIAKIMPIVNNIHSFYARRASRKTETVLVRISGQTYKVDAAFKASLEGLDAEAKREALLSHEKTVAVNQTVEEL